jgi:outer membrane receptor protein involved in Fe transport
VSYHPLKEIEATFAINNVFNTGPPADHSFPGDLQVPYNEFAYNVYGRTYFLTLSYRGGTK